MAAIMKETVTIAVGASLSGALNIDQRNLFAIITPSNLTATALTFQGSYDGTTYYNLYDDTGTEINFSVGTSRYVLVSFPVKFLGLKKLKIRGGTSAAATNQTSTDASIDVIVIPEM